MTTQERESFIAQYWGQTVMRYYGNLFKIDTDIFHWIKDENTYLELKSLSNISDEDIKTICELFLGKECHPKIDRVDDNSFISIEYSNQICEDSRYQTVSMCLYIHDDIITNQWIYNHEQGSAVSDEHLRDSLILYDYLRSKGYALPFRNYSVEDLVKEGIIKLV